MTNNLNTTANAIASATTLTCGVSKIFTLYYTKHNKNGEIVSRTPCYSMANSPMTHAECVAVINKHTPNPIRGLIIVTMSERLKDGN